MGRYFALFVIITILVTRIDCRVKVSFKLKHYENLSHGELDGGCCDAILFSCGSSCDNRFNLCFDVYGGDNDMTHCAYGNHHTDRLYENSDNFNFPNNLASGLSNPIIFTVNSWSRGFRSKIEVWDYDPPPNGDDKIDYYGYNHALTPARTEPLATTHTVTLDGAGTSTTTVEVKVYCAQHYYGTGSGCSTYCLARDDSAGHYDCNDVTGAKMCHPGWTGSNCNIDINECDAYPCQHGASCTNLVNDFSCNCPAGTTGKTCNNINECNSSPCVNGGTCTDSINYYTCTCTIHYTGDRCQFEVDHCASKPCLNGATCLGLDENNVIECTCASGFTGAQCGTNINECVGVECRNGGTCVDEVNGFTCNCTEGYAGSRCELDVRDECASNPCQNNASCVDQVGGYVCVCLPGFQSDQCEENVNECDPDPCVFGNCTDRINMYRCECFEGYTGVNCSEEIDDCIGNLCEHNSTCQDGFNNYTCECMPGYSGEYCETDVDECASAPCQHGGICDQSQAINNFTCDCEQTKYTGTLCENDIDECEFEEPVCREDETCVNMDGGYLCEETPSTSPFPGLCRTSVCYNNGNCSLVDGMYKCICPSDFSGELCETPTAPCTPNPCFNGGFCRVNTAENGSVNFECRCEGDYIGITCNILDPSARTDSGAGGFAYWYIIVIIIILLIVIALITILVYRRRKRKNMDVDGEPSVYANPYAATIEMPTTHGATAAPALPPKGKLDKLGEPDSSLTFTNNLYSDIDELQNRGACAFPQAPPPYSIDDVGHENPYALGGYTPMGNGQAVGNGHAVSPRDDNQYESARDQPNLGDPTQNEYSTDPTVSGSVRRPFGIESGYSTTIRKETRPDSTVVPPPLRLPADHTPASTSGPSALSPSDVVPIQAPNDGPDNRPALPSPSSPDNPYSTSIFTGKDVESDKL